MRDAWRARRGRAGLRSRAGQRSTVHGTQWFARTGGVECRVAVPSGREIEVSFCTKRLFHQMRLVLFSSVERAATLATLPGRDDRSSAIPGSFPIFTDRQRVTTSCLDLRFRLAREQGQPAQRGVHGFPMRARCCSVIAAACGRRTGCVADASHDAAPFSPVTADLVDVPFSMPRTTGRLASHRRPRRSTWPTSLRRPR